jgi:hypothetical protein
MTISRIALRLCTLEALAPSASQSATQWQASTAYNLGDTRANSTAIYQNTAAGTSAASGGPTGFAADTTDGTAHWKYVGPLWPTLGTAHIFDSRLDPIDDLSDGERRPVAVVYTEDDTGAPAQHAGGPPFKRDVDLVIEMSVIAQVTEDGGTYAAGVPFTDGELEASLDLFEAQARFALLYGPTGALWRSLTGRRVLDIHSMRHATSEESARLAMRTLRMKVTIPDDCYLAAPTPGLSGNNRLPEPLKSVVAALAGGSYGAALGAGLAADVPMMPPRVDLDTVTFDIQPGAPPAARDASKAQINASATIAQD